LESLESETVKYGHEPLGTCSRITPLVRAAEIVNDIPILSTERAPYINKPEAA
jgi:hypothetical protein